MKIKIGTRGSKLALVQAEMVANRLKESDPNLLVELVIIKTKGDLIQHKSLDKIGDKGVFVKEIEEQLLAGEIQMAVHSMKDMPSQLPQGLTFSKFWKREDPRDALILRDKKCLEDLPMNAVIGTGSKRRALQLLKIRPDLEIVDIRGNVDTRIQKMHDQKLDGLVLAVAGLKRLGMQNLVSQYMEASMMIPAPAQGILALELASDNEELLRRLNDLSDQETDLTGHIERQFLEAIDGDCHLPIGAWCNKEENIYRLRAMFGKANHKKSAIVDVAGEDASKLAFEAAYALRQKLGGRVYLVGSGPGDEELITVKGRRCIEKAECIIYDRLAPKGLLELAPQSCEKIYVGKARNKHTMKQEEINRLLVKKAMEYEQVVRLKGGDPYVFGRGGEEGLHLYKEGIDFEVVPGISSSLAGLAYAGIPITHRGIAGGFHVISGYNSKGQLADIDFKYLSKTTDTCVFMMGLSQLENIVRRLLVEGKDAKTKVAVISHATTPEQKVCVSDLDHIVTKVADAKLTSPALIVVGDTVGLRPSLNVFEKQSLFGRHYVVTKIGNQTSKMTQLLRDQGGHVEEIAVGQIEHRKVSMTKTTLQEADWLIFTSKHAIDSFFENLKDLELDVRNLWKCKIGVIGKVTGDYLKTYGMCADYVPESGGSQVLADKILETVDSTSVVVYPKASQTDGTIESMLENKCHLIPLTVYENCLQRIGDETHMSPEAIDGAFFSSASSVERFFASMEPERLKQWRQAHDITYVCIGYKTAKALREWEIQRIEVAKTASYESMLDKIMEIQGSSI